MSIPTQLIIITIVVLSCVVAAYSTDHKARVIQKQINENKVRLSALKRGSKEPKVEMKNIEKNLSKLRVELKEAEQSLFSLSSGGSSLIEKLKSSLPLMIGIIGGVIVGAILIVFVPIIVIVILYTIAAAIGSSGLLSEFTRNERRALALSAIPAGLYALTQILLVLGLFDFVFWLFDGVILLTLIGVSIIVGKELPIEIVIILVLILSVWDIYAVLFSNIMGNAVSYLTFTLFGVLIPSAVTPRGIGYALLGGGDLFFSYLLVTAFTRRLKTIPVVLIGLIATSLLGLTIGMYILGIDMAPALPAVLAAGALSTAYYHKRLKWQSRHLSA
nr:hypothetical protein [Candidatus Njordarchaeota archaeon]